MGRSRRWAHVLSAVLRRSNEDRRLALHQVRSDVDSSPVTPGLPFSFSRATRLFTALVTVWCLGCGAFEPLLANFRRAETGGMNCAADQMRGPSSEEGESGASAAGAAGYGGAIEAVVQPEPGYACSCVSCASVSPTAAASPLEGSPPLKAIPQTLAFAESVDREPLVPPPQAHS